MFKDAFLWEGGSWFLPSITEAHSPKLRTSELQHRCSVLAKRQAVEGTATTPFMFLAISFRERGRLLFLPYQHLLSLFLGPACNFEEPPVIQ